MATKRSGNASSDVLGKWYVERAKFVPMRLTLKERKTLRLVDAFLTTSNYVDRVDLAQHANPTRRVHEKLRCIATTFIGLVAALDYAKGKDLASSFEFVTHADTFRDAFEVARRYKIMNPDRLRDSYGG
jgi:hypothetical protein